MSEIRDRLCQRFSSLTRVQKDLSHRLLESYEDYIFLSINEAAQALGVHKSTLVRLAQRLGYPGYTEFRSDLQELYRQEITPGHKLGKTLAEIHEDNLFQQVIETEVMYLREALKTVHPADLRQAAALILKAKRVFICGRGPKGHWPNCWRSGYADSTSTSTSLPRKAGPFWRNSSCSQRRMYSSSTALLLCPKNT